MTLPGWSRDAAIVAAAAFAGFVPAAQPAPEPAPKVLRYAFLVAETSLDPVKIGDLYSRTLTAHVFEAPYRYDHLARPVKLRPLTADGMPVSSDGFRTWTVKIRPGIYFADDPAFKGVPRELVAEDYVYSWKRFADPANKSQVWSSLNSAGLVGLSELRQRAIDSKRPFDYDRPILGIRALDRQTLQFIVKEPRPRFDQELAGSDLFGAVAREVVEFYGDKADEHPVGTGPFKLTQWRRSSRIVFERNPRYRERFYDAEPAAGDAEGQALLARFKGRRLPMVDRVEVSIIEQDQPRWLSFLNGEADFVERIGAEFITVAMPLGKIAPNLARLGIQAYRMVEPAQTMLLFNMDDPNVGGYSPGKVALRRAIGLAMNTQGEIRLVLRNQAVPSESPSIPYTSHFDPAFRSEMSTFDPARAKALLDLYGYVDRDGDGWRDQPDGSPLTLELASQSDSRTRQQDEYFKKNMDALGIRLRLRVAQWPENLKAVRSGAFMLWSVGLAAAGADSAAGLARYDSRRIGGQNMARFQLPAFDALVDRIEQIPDGGERERLFDEADRLAIAYMPYKYRVSRIVNDMAYPWLVGYRRPVFWQDWWQYVDIDDRKRSPG